MSRYVLAEAAELDLVSTWEYIAQYSADAADQLIDKLFGLFEVLAERPGMGHKRRDLTDFPLLFFSEGAYVVIYRNQTTHIEIVAVARGARDIPILLTDRLT